jgi:hypothetical protein
MFFLALNSLRELSPTFDEQGFLTRGVAYLRGENRHLRVGHPLGLNALNGLFLAFDSSVNLPVDDPSWQGTGFHRPSELFLWEIGNNVERVMFLGRLPTLWLGLLLAALAGRWAAELSGRPAAGLLALALLALDPNILAHMRLATTDLGLAAAALLAAFTLWRYWQRPRWSRALLAGIAFGLLQNTKFTAGLFVLLFALVILAALWARRSGDRRRPLLTFVIWYPLAAFATLWAAYGFQIGALPGNLPILPQLSGLTVPLSHHLEQLLDIGGRMQKATPAFLLGRYSDSGWWYYFPVAFILKTSLPALFLLAWALGRSGRCLVRRSAGPGCLSWPGAAFLLLPAFGYFAFALTTDINLGYRHLLPVLPFLYVLAGVSLGPILERGGRPHQNIRRTIVVLSLIWLAAVAWWIRPHFLAYFNLLAGGPDGGWRHLVDSNLDWGQDLQGLAGWMDEHGVNHVWLSYFGEGRPGYYGIEFTGLDSFPPRLMNPAARPYYPHDPAPGIYAISATNLQGVHFEEHDRFAWFRDRPPAAKIGYSIFVYEVPATGQPASVVLAGLQLDQIRPADFALWQTNDVRPHWIDPGQSLLLPGLGPAWLVVAAQAELHPGLAGTVAAYDLVRTAAEYQIYRLPPASDGEGPALVEFARDGDLVLLQVATATATADTLLLETRWLRLAPPAPVQIFVHLTGASGQIISQWDGLGAAWEGWGEGDQLRHFHTLAVPQGVDAAGQELWIGLYEPGSGQRWLWPGGDRYPLSGLAQAQD